MWATFDYRHGSVSIRLDRIEHIVLRPVDEPVSDSQTAAFSSPWYMEIGTDSERWFKIKYRTHGKAEAASMQLRNDIETFHITGGLE